MLENRLDRLVLQCFTGHLLLLGSPWRQFCSASVEEQWEAGQGRTLTFFELPTLSYAIMCHFLVSEIANRFGHFFFIQEPISEELHCGLDRTHPHGNMHVIEAKQTNVIVCQLTTSIYVNLLQQWIWICWISVYHRIDEQKGIWHIKNHQKICSIQQLFFRSLRLKSQEKHRKTMFRYSESFGLKNWGVHGEVQALRAASALHLLATLERSWDWRIRAAGGIETNAPSELPVLASDVVVGNLDLHFATSIGCS